MEKILNHLQTGIRIPICVIQGSFFPVPYSIHKKELQEGIPNTLKIPPTADTLNSVPERKTENAPDQPNQQRQHQLQQQTPLSSPPYTSLSVAADTKT